MALAAVNPTAGITSATPVANFTVSSDSASSVNRTPTAPVVPVVSSSDGITHSVVSSKPTVVDRIAQVGGRALSLPPADCAAIDDRDRLAFFQQQMGGGQARDAGADNADIGGDIVVERLPGRR